LDPGEHFLPKGEQAFAGSPFSNVIQFQLVAQGEHDGGDIAQVLGLLAQAVIPQLVEDEILGRMEVDLAELGAKIDPPAPLKG